MKLALLSPPLRQRLLRALRTLRDYSPLTPLGALLLLCAWLVWTYYATAQIDYVLRATVYLALGLVAFCVLGVALAAALLAWRIHRGAAFFDRQAQANLAFETPLRLPNIDRWPLLALSIEWDGPPRCEVSLVRHEDGSLRERVLPRERGRLSQLTRRVRVQDIFGIAALRVALRSEVNVRVQPALAPGDMKIALRHASAEGYAHPDGEPIGDLIEMRRYTAGDPLRLVLWKIYARTRRLLVRVPERSITPQPSLVAWFVPGQGDEPSAGVARSFLESGAFGEDFLFGTDGSPELLTQPSQALEAIIDSAHHRAQGASAIHRLLQLDRGQLANTLFFVPAVAGPWVDQLALFARSLPQRPTLVLAIDRPTARTAPLWRRALFAPPPSADEGPAHAALVELHARLRAIGDVQLLHRPTGQPLNIAQLALMRERAA